jgi:hypothetical protein
MLSSSTHDAGAGEASAPQALAHLPQGLTGTSTAPMQTPAQGTTSARGNDVVLPPSVVVVRQ